MEPYCNQYFYPTELELNLLWFLTSTMNVKHIIRVFKAFYQNLISKLGLSIGVLKFKQNVHQRTKQTIKQYPIQTFVQTNIPICNINRRASTIFISIPINLFGYGIVILKITQVHNCTVYSKHPIIWQHNILLNFTSFQPFHQE